MVVVVNYYMFMIMLLKTSRMSSDTSFIEGTLKMIVEKNPVS